MQRGRNAGIVKILGPKDGIADRIAGRRIKHAGMGILISPRRFLTCAHVVNAALGEPNDATPRPTSKVEAVFPLSEDKASVPAAVVAWRPMGTDGAADIAVLELDRDAPGDAGVAHFLTGQQPRDDDPLKIFGLRAGYEFGNHVDAVFMGPTGTGEVQIDGKSIAGVFVESGFSGAGVWDVPQGGLVGMVVAREADSLDRVAYMLPVSALASVWPELPGSTNDLLPPFFAEYVHEKTAGFKGRDHVFAEIQAFLANHACGYLTLIGDPGIGKSAIMCELTRRMNCLAHFFISTDGIKLAEECYRYLGQQMHARFGIDTETGANEPPGVRLGRWMAELAKAREGSPVLIVIDGLDECSEVRSPPREDNVLHLPRSLPAGQFVVLSRRDLDPSLFSVQLETAPNTANEVLDLMATRWEGENRADIQRYLEAYLQDRPDHPWLKAQKLGTQEAIDILTARSESNFMYLRQVLPHLEKFPAEFAPAALPLGLKNYYLRHWNRMTERWRDHEEAEAVFATVYQLAVAQKPVTRSQLGAMLPEVRPAFLAMCLDQWHEFLTSEHRSEPAEHNRGDQPFRIYHSSFTDFLANQDEIVDAGRRRKKANQRMKNWFLALMRGK